MQAGRADEPTITSAVRPGALPVSRTRCPLIRYDSILRLLGFDDLHVAHFPGQDGFANDGEEEVQQLLVQPVPETLRAPEAAELDGACEQSLQPSGSDLQPQYRPSKGARGRTAGTYSATEARALKSPTERGARPPSHGITFA